MKQTKESVVIAAAKIIMEEIRAMTFLKDQYPSYECDISMVESRRLRPLLNKGESKIQLRQMIFF
jgi:hypothetical protein